MNYMVIAVSIDLMMSVNHINFLKYRLSIKYIFNYTICLKFWYIQIATA